jgi:signal transduction histidine kinase
MLVMVVLSTYMIIQGGHVEKQRQKAEDELQDLKDSLQDEVARKTEELLKTQRQLISSERLAAMGQLGATIAHEFRNQLGVMKNATYFLHKKLQHHQDAKILKHLKILEEEINRTDDIINDILTFARAKDLVINTINIKQLIDSVKRKIDFQNFPNVTFSVNIATDVIDMCADETQLIQILVNLLRNAFESIHNEGHVSLDVRLLDGQIEFAVTDTGVGISPEMIERVFEPLYTTKARGTGLGLPTVKMLIERHKGSLTIDSVEHEGTTVTVHIPRICDQTEKSA